MADGGRPPVVTGAGGGGSKKPRTPIEAPDSLKSTAFAHILDLVSEGPIKGLKNGLKSVFYDETPLQNEDDSFNFSNVFFDSRLGTQDQSHMEGFSSVENEVGIGFNLTFSNPYVRTITNTELDAQRVRVSVPALQKQDMSNGDTNGYSVVIVIDLQVGNEPYKQVIRSAITGKTTTKYERSFRIQLPESSAGWRIRVRRLTPNANSATVADQTIIESVTDIIEGKFRYPNSAYFAHNIDAQQFPSIPRRAFHCEGLIIKTPSNYNAETRTYTGVWDGNFIMQYTNNPAWCFYALLTSRRWGLGRRIRESDVNKWELYRIARYCDELVDDGFGNMEPRFCCNVYLQTREDAFQTIRNLSSIFRGMSYWAAGAVQTTADMPADPVYHYNASNVIDGRFVYAGSARLARHTVALVTWSDMSDFCRPKTEYVEDLEGIRRYGIHELETVAFGCTSRSQAIRMGKWMLTSERIETDSVTWSVGMDGVIAAPGKIVKITDPMRSGERLGGRVLSSTSNTAMLDGWPDPAVGDKINVIQPSGIAIEREITAINPGLSTVTFGSIGSGIAEDSVWVLEKTNVKPMLVKILAVAENRTKEGLTFQITALEYRPEKHAYVDSGERIPDSQYTGELSAFQRPVSFVQLAHNTRVDYNSSSIVVRADWLKLEDAKEYEVSWRFENGDWSAPQRVEAAAAEITNAYPGEYTCKVTAFGHGGAASNPTVSAPYLVPASDLPPGFATEMGETLEELTQRQLQIQQQLDQSIADQAVENLRIGEAAALDAANKVATATASLQGQIDAVIAEVGEIVGAPEHDPNQTYQAGWLVTGNGGLYRAIRDTPVGVELANTDWWTKLGDYSSVGQAVGAALQQINVAVSDLAVEVARTDTLIARMPAGNGKVVAEALFNQLQQTVTNLDESVANSLQLLLARMPSGNGMLASEASVAAAESASATRDQALGETISTINARLPVQGGALALAASVTNLQQAMVDANGVLAQSITEVKGGLTGGGNLLTNSDYIANIDGYVISGANGVTVAPDTGFNNGTLSNDPTRYLPVGWNGLMLHASNTVAAMGYLQYKLSNNIPAAPGQRYFASVIYNAFRCDCSLIVLFLDSAGAILPGIKYTTAGSTGVSGPVLQQMGFLQSGPVVAPPNTAFVSVAFELSGNGGNNPYVWFTRPMLEVGVSGQTTASPWSAGPNESAVGSAIQALTVANGVATAVTEVRNNSSTGNQLPTTGFQGMLGWELSAANVPSSYFAGSNNGTISGDANTYAPLRQPSLLLNAAGTLVAGHYIQVGTTDFMPVKQGERYILSCWVNSYRCSTNCVIFYYDRAGAYMGRVDANSPATAIDQADFNNTPRRSCFVDILGANVGFVKVGFELGGRGEANPCAWFTRPMLEKVTGGALKETPSTWVEGAAGLAATTVTLRADQASMWTLAQNVGGKVSGMVSKNDGYRSTIEFLTDAFRVFSSGMEGFEVQGGYSRWYSAGAQLVIGHNFGVGGLILWYGPNIGAAACQKLNATIWFDKTGNAYFGGALSAGSLTSSGSFNFPTQTVGEKGRVTHANSSGRPKTVIFSYQYGDAGTNSYSSSAAANNFRNSWLNNPTTMALVFRIQRGNVVLGDWLAQATSQVGAVEYLDTVPPQWRVPYSHVVIGSQTFPDNSTGTGNQEYIMLVDSVSGTPKVNGGRVGVTVVESA